MRPGHCRWSLLLLVFSAMALAQAAPGDTLFYDNLNGNLNNWTVNESDGDANIDNNAAQQGRSLELRWGAVSVRTDVIDAAVPGAELTLWIRRGANSFSDAPESDDDLVIEYRNSSNNWIIIDTYSGGGTAGQIYTPAYQLSSGALHSNLSVRLRLTNGDGSDFDYWHIDEFRVTETAAAFVSNPVLLSFDEGVWTGAPGEVEDSGSRGLTGSAYGGASNQGQTPALSGDPGTCRYGEFDGNGDYIEFADNAAFDFDSQLTVGAWVYMRSLPGSLHTIVSKDWNYEFHINSSGQVYWWWNETNGTVRTLTTGASISLNQWHHIAIVFESGAQTIYVDGSAWATSSFSGSLRLNDNPLYIGRDLAITDRDFDGYIDEVYIDGVVSSQSEVQALRDARHQCPEVSPQFILSHDGFGIHCVAETITVNVIDAISGTPLTSYNADVRLDTQTGTGTWSLVSGSGAMLDATPDDGQAVYSWPLNESEAEFALSYMQGTPIFDIDAWQVSDSGVRDSDAEGPISFSASGFTLTAAPLSNPPPGSITPFDQTQTAGAPFTVYIAAYGQTANDAACGVIESYSGNRNLKFWSNYLNPSSGFVAVEVDGNPVATSEGAAANQSVTFTNGQAAIGVRYKDVGSMQVAVKDDTTTNAELPSGISGATAAFVSRPADFLLSAIASADGTISNPFPVATDHNGSRFIAAGAPFRATVTALDADGDPTPNYGRETIAETVRLESVLVAPSGGNNPSVTAATGFAAFSSGTATGTDFVWPEVGIMQLRPAVGDNDYLGAGDVIGTVSNNVGRFVPADFLLAANTPLLDTQCDAGAFTYSGQAFGYAVAPSIVATAVAVGGSTTRNYSGDFFRLDTTTLQNLVYSSSAGSLDTSGLPAPLVSDPAVAETAAGVASITFSAGSGFRFSRATLAAPFDAVIGLAIDIVDDDGIAATANPAQFGAASGIDFTAGRSIRYGRLAFTNAVGSELVDLFVPLRTEYYDGPAQGFRPNAGDSCTAGVSVTLGPFTENLGAGETCVLDTGAPGVSGAGCPDPAAVSRRFNATAVAGDFNLSLAAPGGSNHGSAAISADAPTWLEYDWDSSSAGNEDPSGNAVFGIYGGESSQLYIREIY